MTFLLGIGVGAFGLMLIASVIAFAAVIARDSEDD